MNDQQFVGIHFHAVTVNCRCQFCSHSDSLHFNTVKPKLVALCVPFVFSLSSPPQLNEMLVLPAISKSSLPRRRRRHTSSTESVPLTDKTDWICVFEFLFFCFKWLFAFVFIHHNWVVCVRPCLCRSLKCEFCILCWTTVGRGLLIYV